MASEMIEKITEVIKGTEDWDYDFWGLRTDDRDFAVGDILPASYRWEDGTMTDEELSGTCAVIIEDANVGAAMRIAKAYDPLNTRHMYLVYAKCALGGEDYGEIVMRDAKVMMVIR